MSDAFLAGVIIWEQGGHMKWRVSNSCPCVNLDPMSDKIQVTVMSESSYVSHVDENKV